MGDRLRVLILGGTAEARALATEAAASFDLTYSLAGRTDNPALPDGVTVRSGGFGGIDALAEWIKDNDIAAVIDATHPFADTIAGRAAEACTATDTARLKLLRPSWSETAGDTWHHVPDIREAATLLPSLGSSAFLSVGRQELTAFAGVTGVKLVVRTIDPPAEDFNIADAVFITGRGPFSTANEAALLREHRIDVLVSKNAGGAATYPKLAAARAAGIPVVMIDRPTAPAGPVVSDIGAAIRWLEKLNA